MRQHFRFWMLDGGFWSRAIEHPKSKIQHINWPLTFVVLLGVALRLWLIGVSPLDPRFSNADDGDYYQRALRFAVTGQYIDDSWLIRPPLHVFFFAFWLRLALILGQPALGILLIKLAQTLVAALAILLGYAIADRLFASRRAGLLFAAFLALWYPFVEQPAVLFSELLYLFLFLLHLWLLLRFDAGGGWRNLALAGVALGAAALTRSPALYSLAFVALWLFVRAWGTWRIKNKEQRTNVSAIRAPSLFSVLCSLFLVVVCCLAVVGPWTIRNALVYRRFIPVDTLGQINLWLDLDSVARRDEHIAALRQLPQADRQSYAMARAREILAADPLRPFRSMWETFRHIWKMQYVEDFFVKKSFFTRSLRASAPLGLLGDAIWVIYTLGGLVGLAAPAREGLHNRLFVLAWLGYSLLTVLLFHVEPRYLLPIWTLVGLYGAWTLAQIRPESGRTGERENQRTGELDTKAPSPRHPVTGLPWWSRLAQTALVVGYLALLLTYRDYPAIVASGVARERAMVAGERAYAAGDYASAERAFRDALAAQPNFVDAQVGLVLALAAQHHRDEAAALLSPGASRRSDLVAGALARDAGDLETAGAILTQVETIAGEDIQDWAVTWLRPPPTDALTLGSGLDIGYIAGFAGGESGSAQSFRWLKDRGRIILPLPKPLGPGAALVLRMAGGRPGATPLDVWIGGRRAARVPVQSGQWREYQLAIPAELANQRRLVVELRAPTFVPALLDRASDDARALSLMISSVRVQY